MSSKRLRLFIIEQLMNFIILYPVVGVMIGYYSSEYINLFGGVIVLITTIIMNICLKKINNRYFRFVTQMLLPILCFAVVWVSFSNLFIKYIIIGYLLVSMLMYYISISRKEIKIRSFPYMFLGEIILGGTYFFAYTVSVVKMEMPIVIFALLLAFLSIYYVSSSRIEFFMEQEKQYTHNELSKVYNMNMLLFIGIAMGILIICIILHLLIYSFGINVLLQRILVIPVNLFLLMLNAMIGTDYKAKSVSQDEKVRVTMQQTHISAQAEQASRVFDEVILCVFIAIILVFVLSKLFGIYKNLKNLGGKNETSERVKGEEEKSESTLDIFSTISKLFNTKKTNKEKVRKEYYKFVKTNSKGKVEIQNSDVPFEIDDKVSKVLKKEVKDITKLYEKARYSKETISDEQVKNIKQLIKESKNMSLH